MGDHSVHEDSNNVTSFKYKYKAISFHKIFGSDCLDYQAFPNKYSKFCDPKEVFPFCTLPYEKALKCINDPPN